MSEIKHAADYRAKMRRGTWVIGGLLTVFTILEYIVAVSFHGQWALLMAALLVAAVAKAWFIVRDFMHVAQIWGGEHH